MTIVSVGCLGTAGDEDVGSISTQGLVCKMASLAAQAVLPSCQSGRSGDGLAALPAVLWALRGSSSPLCPPLLWGIPRGQQ